jgi:endonuclease/exonuclease/phosphatase family metal-dependent hydrolase
VVTLNIWNRQGPWEVRLGLIRREVEALAPDLMGLQEVLKWGESDQAREIGEGFGLHATFGSAWEIGGGVHFGNALLSRWPVAESHVFQLPGAEDSGETRALLYAKVEAPFGPIPVFVTHLNWKLHQGSIRLQQVAFIADKVAALAPVAAGGYPPIVMGDFNAEPASDEIRFLKGYHAHEGRSVYFADAWTFGGDGSAGHTFARDNGFARRAHEESRRLDYIWVRGPDRQLRGEPLRTRVAFTAKVAGPGDDGYVWPSDHYGVTTDLTVDEAERKPS